MQFVFQMDILEVFRESDFTTAVEMVTLEVNIQQCQKSKYNCCHETINSCLFYHCWNKMFRKTFTVYDINVHNIFTVYDINVHNIFTVYNINVHNIFTVYDINVHNIFCQITPIK